MNVEQFIALNEEIAALARAGVPLDRSLAELGDEMPGRLGRVAASIADRTAKGEPLDEAILDETGTLSPAYQAVVRAGLRAGRLPAALEAVAGSARRLTETYRAAVVAVAYPLMILALVWLSAVVMTTVLAPRLAESFQAMELPGAGFFAVLAEIGRWAWYWGPVGPAAVVILIAAWWLACRRAALMHTGGSARMLSGLPWIGPMLRYTRAATFLEILALLIENRTPLDEAVAMAADASGDLRTRRAARRWVALKEASSDFPPLLSWLIFSARSEGTLLPALKRGAAAYHRRALHQADMVRTVMPIVLTVAFAATITVGYVLMIFAPYVSALYKLSEIAGT